MAKRKTTSSTRGTGSGNAGNAAHATSNNISSPMSVELLERLVKLMAANDLNTVDLRDGERRVVLKRGALAAAGGSSGFMPVLSVPAHAAHPGTANPGFPSPAAGGAHPSVATTASDSDKDLTGIKSPMVGTFYAAPSPDAPPFVSVGSEVDEETDVCIIEAMKVFNNIKADVTGQIAKILVTNGQTVEFGTVLFLVKPN